MYCVPHRKRLIGILIVCGLRYSAFLKRIVPVLNKTELPSTPNLAPFTIFPPFTKLIIPLA